MDISSSTRGLDQAGPGALVARLCRATNAHDLEAVVACFAPDYRNETPAHPERGFTGSDQVRKNWQQIFATIPTSPQRCCVALSRVTRHGQNGSTAEHVRTGANM